MGPFLNQGVLIATFCSIGKLLSTGMIDLVFARSQTTIPDAMHSILKALLSIKKNASDHIKLCPCLTIMYTGIRTSIT